MHHFVVRDCGALVGHAVLNVAGATGGVYDMGWAISIADAATVRR